MKTSTIESFVGPTSADHQSASHSTDSSAGHSLSFHFGSKETILLGFWKIDSTEGNVRSHISRKIVPLLRFNLDSNGNVFIYRLFMRFIQISLSLTNTIKLLLIFFSINRISNNKTSSTV